MLREVDQKTVAKFQNVVLDKEGKDQMDRQHEK
jgi:hypothetical protein